MRSLAVLAATLATSALFAQSSGPVVFEVVSIKAVTELRQTSGFRTLPDGSEVMSNIPVAGFVREASPVKVRDVVGLPEWATTERFDVTAKPPAGTTAEQRRVMWGAVFADRMKWAAHIEQREQTVYALVTARSDGRLGSGLKPSALDCTPRPKTPPEDGPAARFSDFGS